MFQMMNVPAASQASRLLAMVQQCQNTCEGMVSMMLSTPDVQARRNQIRLLSDCATICATLACYLARPACSPK